MSCKRGFEVNVNHKKYLVVADMVYSRPTKYEDSSIHLHIEVQVFCNGVLTKPNHYAQEKICDFIKNTINGQDTLYWNPDGKNRHLEELE